MADDTKRNLPLDPVELETTGVTEATVQRQRLHSATTEILGGKAAPDQEPDIPPSPPSPRRGVGASPAVVTALLALIAFVVALAVTVWWLRR